MTWLKLSNDVGFSKQIREYTAVNFLLSNQTSHNIRKCTGMQSIISRKNETWQ